MADEVGMRSVVEIVLRGPLSEMNNALRELKAVLTKDGPVRWRWEETVEVDNG